MSPDRSSGDARHPSRTELLAFVEGELESPAFREVHEHLAGCDVCAGTCRELVEATTAERMTGRLRRKVIGVLAGVLLVGAASLAVAFFGQGSDARYEEVRRLYRTGRWDEAEPLLARLAEEAVDDPSEQSHDSGYWLATIRNARGDLAGALDAVTLAELAVRAQEASGLDRRSLAVGLGLLRARFVMLLGDVDRGLALEGQVLDSIDALPDGVVRLNARKRVLQHLLWKHFRFGAPRDDVRRDIDALLDVGERLAALETGPDRANVDTRSTAARALLNLWLVYGNPADLEAGQTLHRLPVPSSLVEANPLLAAWRAETSGLLAMASGSETRAPEAPEWFEVALSLYRSAAGWPRGYSDTYRHLGCALAAAGRVDEARTAFDRAEEEASANRDERILAQAARAARIGDEEERRRLIDELAADPSVGWLTRTCARRWLETEDSDHAVGLVDARLLSAVP